VESRSQPLRRRGLNPSVQLLNRVLDLAGGECNCKAMQRLPLFEELDVMSGGSQLLTINSPTAYYKRGITKKRLGTRELVQTSVKLEVNRNEGKRMKLNSLEHGAVRMALVWTGAVIKNVFSLGSKLLLMEGDKGQLPSADTSVVTVHKQKKRLHFQAVWPATIHCPRRWDGGVQGAS